MPVIHRGFTLLEILVSISILIILTLLIENMTTATMRVTHMSNQSIDAASQARLAFDCIGADLAAAIRRSDVDFIAQNPSMEVDPNAGVGSNVLFFLASVVSPGTLSSSENRGVSMVAYKLAKHADNANRLCLVRASLPISRQHPSEWGSASFMGLKSNGLPVKFDDTSDLFPKALVPDSSSFDILAPGVIRIVVGFQLYPDNKSVTLNDNTDPAQRTVLPQSLGQIVYYPPLRQDTDGKSYIDVNRISSIVVGLVVVDLGGLKLLSASQVLALAKQFGSISMNETPVSAWKDRADSISATGIPARAAVRVFQRFYSVTPFGERPL